MSYPRSSLVAAWLLAVTGATAGTEASAPLESTKQELRALERKQKSQAEAVPGSDVKVDTPALQVPVGDAGTPQQWLRQQTEGDRKREQRQRDSENWLVNGVRRLAEEGPGAESKIAPAVPGATESVAAARPIDTSDPQYLLKLFDDQKKPDESRQPDTKARPAPDPFAPFLQQWLGTSPVRTQVLAQIEGHPQPGTGPGPAGGPGDYRPAPGALSPGSMPSTAPPATVADKSNPYLVDQTTPMPARDAFASAPASIPGADLHLATPVPITPALSGPALIAPSLPEVRTPPKGPPPNPADEKKYFPQLNRF